MQTEGDKQISCMIDGNRYDAYYRLSGRGDGRWMTLVLPDVGEVRGRVGNLRDELVAEAMLRELVEGHRFEGVADW